MTDKQITRNQRYNAERQAQSELMKRDLDRDRLLARLYQESYDRLQKQIDRFYIAYAKKEGLTRSEAIKRASEMDVTRFNEKAAKAVKDKDFSHATNEWLRTYNLKMKVSRLELLKAELSLEIQNLTAQTAEVFDKARQDEYLNEYKRQAGILGISSSGAKKRMQSILEADFYGQNFSNRVWGGNGLQSTLQRDVFSSLNRIFTDMMGYKKEMMLLSKKYGTNEKNAERLLKTEIARINSDTQLALLKENGFTHLIYVAEVGACKICQPLDGKAIPIEDAEHGVNLYPMHPNCRCSSYGHIEMKYKSGGSTLDREAPNGVWSEDNQNKPNQKQVGGEQRKRIAFDPKDILFEEHLPKKAEKAVSKELPFFNRSAIVLRQERLEHILEGHADIGVDVAGSVHRVIQKPDKILVDHKNKDSLLVIGKGIENNVNVAVRLSRDERDNSIITAMRVSDKTIRRILRKNKKIYDKDE